jgi:RNA polymerase sigma-70 factor (ECF subfamily)
MNKTEFGDLVRNLARRIYGYAFRFLRNQEEAEDAVQEVFLKLWNMREKLGNYESIEALATTMTRNYCIDRLRRNKNNVHDAYDAVNVSFVFNETPYEVVVNKESDTILRSIISTLPDNMRSILVMKEIDELSYEEIADITGQTLNNLRVIIARARKYVRDEFNKIHYERRGHKKAAGEIL